jgi:DNA polymerase I-like protein with 3'-5' exonuclease and polymerase domains
LGEEAQYRGLDAATRALFNALAQSGTASITKIMMLGSAPLCAKFDARLLLQIHDELVFEVPQGRVTEFLDEAVPFLQGLVPGFAVPTILEPKFGARFGALEWRTVKAMAAARPPRYPRRPGRHSNLCNPDVYI